MPKRRQGSDVAGRLPGVTGDYSFPGGAPAPHGHASRGVRGSVQPSSGLSGFEERLEAAKVFFHHEVRICAQHGEQTRFKCTKRIGILNLCAHSRTAALRIVAELDPAARFKLRARQ